MRMILSFKMKNGQTLHLVANAATKEFAKVWAINNWGALLKEQAFEIDKETEITGFEAWAQDKKASNSSGYKKYVVSFYLNGNQVGIQVQAQGVKSAYNNVKLSYKLQENINMFIYELGQRVVRQKKSAKAESTKLVESKDKEKIRKILLEAAEKVNSFPALGPIAEEVILLIQMIWDVLSGKYKEVPMGTIIGVVACIIYFVSPIDVIPDVVPVAGQLDDVAVVTWAVKSCHDDIVKYKRWLAENGEQGKQQDKSIKK